ncbi:MAG: type II toxin-antitoxin system VapC family toxin [Candidatus Aenigmarchaeota archaeon]|nr:type II toxin-antitoxin system VapC family toxin [Candidatus Aenigmarchaeota archaeon]
MYCLDTDILIHHNRGDKNIIKKVVENSGNLSTTYMNVCELFKGAELSGNPEKHRKIAEDTISNLTILDFSMECARIYSRDYKKLREKGKMIEEFDILIAAIAKSCNAILVTRNKKHFEIIENLQTEEW